MEGFKPQRGEENAESHPADEEWTYSPFDPSSGSSNRPSFPAVTADMWRSAGKLALGGWLGTLAVSLFIVVLALLAGGSAFGDDSLEMFLPSGGNFFSWIFQLVSLGLFGTFTVEVSGFDPSVLDGGEMSARIPLTAIPIALVAGVVAAGKYTKVAKIDAIGPRSVVAVVMGVAVSSVISLTALVFRIRLDADTAGAALSFNAVSFTSFVVGALIASVGIFFCLVPGLFIKIPLLYRQALRVGLGHLSLYWMLAGIIITVVIAVKSDAFIPVIANALILVPLLGLYGLAFGHFASIDISHSDWRSHGLWLFSAEVSVPLSLTVLAITLIVIVFAGLAWRLARGPITDGMDWAALPIIYGATGVLVTAFGAVRATFEDQVASLGPAAWTFLIFAVVGLLVDLTSRIIAVPILRVLPPGFVKLLAMAVGERRIAVARSGEKTVGGKHGRGATSLHAPAKPEAEPFVESSSPGSPPADTGNLPVQPTEPQQEALPKQTEEAPAEELVSPFADFPTEDDAQAAPLSKKAKRRLKIVGAALLIIPALALLVGKGHGYLAENRFGPEQKAKDYLQALIDGRASDAMALYSPNVTNDRRGLLSDDLYKVTKNRPTDYRIGSTDITDDGAIIEAFLTQNGKEHPVEFTLATEGSQAFFFDDWRIDSGPISFVDIHQAPDSLRVNGVDIDVVPALPAGDILVDEGDDQEDDYASEHELDELDHTPILPGDYLFEAPAGSRFTSYGDDIKITVNPMSAMDMEAGVISFKAAYNENVLEEVESQVSKAITKCDSSDNKIIVDGCEIGAWEARSWEAMRIKDRSWTSGPTVHLIPRGEGENGSGNYALEDLSGPLSAVIEAELKLTYEVRDDAEHDWIERETTFNPFDELDSDSWWGGLEEFPIEITDESLTVDLSAINSPHTDRLK